MPWCSIQEGTPHQSDLIHLKIRFNIVIMCMALKTKFPKGEIVIAWNQPMLKVDGEYVFGLSVAKNHITIAPWGEGVIDKFLPKLKDYEVNKKTIKVPVDWKVDTKLLTDMAAASIKATKK